MDFLEKLNLLMKKNKFNKNSLSKASGIPYTTIDNWYKRGYDNLQLPTIKKLCSFFDTSLDFWLKDDVIDPNYGKSSGFSVDYDEMEHIKKYRELDIHGREMVDFTLEKETDRIKKYGKLLESPAAIIDISIPHDDTGRLVKYFRSASAGEGVFILGNEVTDQITIPNTPENAKVDYAIKVSGRSMEPDYYDGDTVLVSQKVEINYGDIGIFIVNGNAYIKEYGKTELISHNPEADNIKISEHDNIVCMGKVIGKL